MCGIFGYSLTDGEHDLMGEGRRALLGYKLAEANDTRGGQSWGVAKIGKDGKPRIEKGLGKFQDRPFALLNAHTMMGHCRWATHGDRTVANSHPFEIGKIVGAHNGIFHNHYELNRKHSRKFEVDSMHAFAHLDAGMPLDDIEGYGTLEWYKADAPGDIYLCKLKGGVLTVAGLGEYPDAKGVVWSSDEKHLEDALKAIGIKKSFTYKIETGEVYYVRAGKLYCADEKLSLSTSSSSIISGKTWEDYRSESRTGSGYSSGYYDGKYGHWDDVNKTWVSKEDGKADKAFRTRMHEEKIKEAKAILKKRADAGDTDCAFILAAYKEGNADDEDLLLALDEQVGPMVVKECIEATVAGLVTDADRPTAEEEKEEITKVLKASGEDFQIVQDEMSERWKRIGKAMEEGSTIRDEDADLVMFMKGR